MLLAFPQYSSTADTWGNVGNVSYNSLQISLNQRPRKGLTYTLNYTYSKNLGDDGTFRSGFDIPAAATSNGTAWHQDRIERSFTTAATPQALALYGVYELPFAKNSGSRLVRNLAGGWQLSGIFTYGSGTPLAITTSGCNSPGQGQCMPDLNASFSGPARINGKWGKGITAANLSAIPYISSAAFAKPATFATAGPTPLDKIGTLSRTQPLGLFNPSHYNVDASVRRTFAITPERVKFILEVDCLDLPNTVTFGSVSTVWGSSTFGTVGAATGNRDFQLAGRINF